MQLCGNKGWVVCQSSNVKGITTPIPPPRRFAVATAAGKGAVSTAGTSASSTRHISGPTATLKAAKTAAQPIIEKQRALAEYMALPASQYSVLDARKIERIDDTTFKCYVGQLRFVSWEVEPVITVQVQVQERGCTIRLLSCTLQGSKFIEEVNNKFTARMTNVVRWQEGTGGSKQIISDTDMEVVLQIPAWCSWIPAASISSAGSSVLQSTLNMMVPRFLTQLNKDYEKWAAGASRKPAGSL